MSGDNPGGNLRKLDKTQRKLLIFIVVWVVTSMIMVPAQLFCGAVMLWSGAESTNHGDPYGILLAYVLLALMMATHLVTLVGGVRMVERGNANESLSVFVFGIYGLGFLVAALLVVLYAVVFG